jgi:hypothetical protein
VNPAQLSAYFAAHKTAILGGAAAGVAVLGLRARKKAAAPATSQPAGTLPAAAVVPANGLQSVGSTYDSSAYDVYSALQSELTPFLQGQAAQTSASSGISSVPAVASTLFGPTGSGHLVRYPNGSIAEVESDGTLYGLNPDEWNNLRNAGQTYTSLPDTGPVNMFSAAGNLQAKNPVPAAKS